MQGELPLERLSHYCSGKPAAWETLSTSLPALKVQVGLQRVRFTS